MEFARSALLVIDMQYDFMAGGSLEVANASELIGPINELMKLDWKLVVASQDWHPKNHVSFASNHAGKKPFEEIILSDGSTQVLWPDHCIQNTAGAAIHQQLDTSLINDIVLKGQNATVDSYSAFFDNKQSEKTGMDDLLKAHNITDVYIVGLAGDYCVKATAIDALQLDYTSYFVSDATKSVNLGTDILLYKELETAGVTVINIEDIH